MTTPLSIAPMLDWTDRFERFFLRLISRHALLYTEMITTGALLHGDTDRFLKYDETEHPVALQLGGSNPEELARCAKIGADAGYDEINLNVGCPSDRVQSGRFGACLMNEPQLVAECIDAMQSATTVPVSLKHRTGVDDNDSQEALLQFVDTVSRSGIKRFIVHARKAWLKGLSPKQNRDVPPLHYERVYAVKQAFPQLDITINGGITTLAQAQSCLQHVDGVMVGREAYHNPYMLAQADRLFYSDDHPVDSRHEILRRYLPFVEKELHHGVPLNHISRHIIGLFHQCPGARSWRRYISEHAHKPGAGPEVLEAAALLVDCQA